uniref:C2H2-type domain-containing protein n=1 Tax=Steinernema glaseri TaxID=37863 RepID=A0A1I7ZRI6_9BILA
MTAKILSVTLLLVVCALALEPTNENVNSFDAVDLDGNQAISFKELEKWLKNEQHVASARVTGLFHSHDTNQDGQLDVSEFVPLAYALSKKPLSQSEHIFKRIDLNGDGVLTREEAEASKEQIPVEILNGLFSVADIDKDGKISYKELSAVLDNYEKPKSLDDIHLEAAQRLIDLIDQDGDHKVTPKELFEFSKQYSEVSQTEIATEGPLPAIMIPTDPGDLLERCLDVLERSLTMESTLSRLVEGQEELRSMIMAMVNGTTPASTSIQHPAMKEEEYQDDEIEMVDLPSATAVSPLRVKSAEEDDDIGSVSSVISEEDVDHMDSSSVHDLEGDEKNPPGRPTCGDLPVPDSVTGSFSLGAEESDEEDDGASSMSSEHEASIYGEETDLDDKFTGRNSSENPSASNTAIPERLALWKCAVCGKLIKGIWQCRQYHIESHEGLKLSCPVIGCSARRSSSNFFKHLTVEHKTAKNSLTVEQRAELQRQQDENNQKAMACEMKYFPPSSLVSFAETSGRIAASCKKCGKICAAVHLRRDHVGAHLNMKMHCPLRVCKYSGSMGSVKQHLSGVHEKTLAKLTVGERYRFEEARRKFYEEVDAVMADYFPEILQTEKRPTEEKKPFCKKCGKRASELNQRRDHVGTHLKAKFPCPFRHCTYSGRLTTMFAHLYNKHGMNLQKLTEEQRGRFGESRRKFCEQVDAVMDKYFSCT